MTERLLTEKDYPWPIPGSACENCGAQLAWREGVVGRHVITHAHGEQACKWEAMWAHRGPYLVCSDWGDRLPEAPPAVVEEIVDEALKQAAKTLEEIVERLEDLRDWAIDVRYPAIEHKIDEGIGAIMSAAEAANQYLSGELSA